MDCNCPAGYPKRQRRSFGNDSRAQALHWDVPVPGFEVEAHAGECSLSDNVKVPLLSYEVSDAPTGDMRWPV